MKAQMKPVYFTNSSAFREWLEVNRNMTEELWLGFYKRGSGRPSITYAEALDQALCYGWIDGVRMRIDDQAWAIRFTPRKPRSVWSAVNIKHARRLVSEGLMQPAGLKAFKGRADERSALYSYEQRRSPVLPPPLEKEFKKDRKAWDWFQSRPPSYRKPAIWWIISAKREETQRKRLDQLMADSNKGRTIKPLTRRS